MRDMKRNNRITGLALFLLMLAAPLRAQILSAGDLFGPGAPPPMIGVEIGIGQHTQNGTFQAICKCSFGNGSGIGFLGGLLFELPLSYEWTIGLGTKLDFKTYTTSTNVEETATVTYNNGNSVATADFPFERDGSVKETFLVLAPFLRYELARNGPFVQAGPGIGLLISSNFTHTRVLNTTTLTIDSGKTISGIRFQNGTREEQLETGKIANAAGTRISVLASAGWNILVGDNAVFAPMVTMDIPLTKVRDDFVGESGALGWKITSLYFSVGLKYKLD